MLQLIPARGAISTAQIQSRLGDAGHPIDLRTIQRDLDILSGELPLVKDDSSKPYGWRWADQARRLDIPMMTEAEALSFYLVELHLRGLLPESTVGDLRHYFHSAREKLSKLAEDAPVRNWKDRVRVVQPTQTLLAPTVSAKVREVVTAALLRGQQLEIRYRAPSQTVAKEHRIHPLGLIQHGTVFYLAVRYFEYENVRTIALHRIISAEAIDEPARAPKGFQLDRWINEGAFGFGELGISIHLRLEFFDHGGDHLLESRLSDDQTVEVVEDGRLIISATVLQTERLKWWLLAFGACVEILEPESLRREIVDRLHDALSRYKPTNRPLRRKRLG